MNRDLEQKIKYDCEGPTLDYKKEEYPLGKNNKRNEFLKDICAFANHHSDEDKFIIIGVEEENGVAKDFFEIENITDEASYQNFANENIEPTINFEYKSFIYNDKKLAFFRIYNNKSRPYLFKRDVQSLGLNKTDFRAGDGFIRVGSSSKKIARNDLENIYNTRFTNKDRKGDLDIEPYFAVSDDEDLSKLDIKYFDIKITNHSNKSIDFDVEMKVFKSNGVILISKDELKRELKKKRKTNYSFGFDFEMIQPQINNLHIYFKEEEEFILISRNRMTRKTAISLLQNSSEKDVFCQHLFVLNKDEHEIKVELTIRSDDFTEGLLKQEFVFKR